MIATDMGDFNFSKESERVFALGQRELHYYSLEVLERLSGKRVDRLPYSLRVLLENVLRFGGGDFVRETISTNKEIEALLNWESVAENRSEIPYMPARVVMQDFTGVPAVVDLAAMRESAKQMGYSADKINPSVETDLVIDHSVQVDFYGNENAFKKKHRA